MRLPSADLVRRALSGHAAIGLLAGGLIYLLCLSGALIVFHEEWQRWEQPSIAESATLSPAAAQQAAANVLAREAAEGKKTTEHLWIRLPNDVLPRSVVTTDNGASYVDADGRVLAPEAHAWTEFLNYLHYYLHLPSTLGLIVVGVLGAMLAALIVGGVLAHPRIFRDAFRLRARGPKQLAYTDWHNRIGVWTLPFGLAVSLTGAMIGLSIIMSLAIRATWYGGDREKAFAPLYGAEPVHDAARAPLPDIAAALRDFAARKPDVRASYVFLHDPLTRGQELKLLGVVPRRLIFGDYFVYDSAGRYLRNDGMSDGAIGQQASASVYGLHFGSYGGLPVKLLYLAGGMGLAVVTGTGMAIWLMKRRQRGRPSPRLEAMWTATLWGPPLLIALAYVLRAALGPTAPMIALFWAGLGLLLALGLATAKADALRTLLRTTGGATIAGIGLVHALAADVLPTGPLVIDLALLATGLAMLTPELKRLTLGALSPAGAEPMPAE